MLEIYIVIGILITISMLFDHQASITVCVLCGIFWPVIFIIFLTVLSFALTYDAVSLIFGKNK